MNGELISGNNLVRNKTGESPTSNYDSPSERGGENDKVKEKLVCVCVMCQIVDRGHEREKWDRSISWKPFPAHAGYGNGMGSPLTHTSEIKTSDPVPHCCVEVGVWGCHGLPLPPHVNINRERLLALGQK